MMPLPLDALILASLTLLSTTEVDLQGTWTGNGLRLEIDANDRIARYDGGPEQRFTIEDVTGKMVVFTIGTERFFGLFDNDTLSVTRTGDRTAKTLRRSELRPTLRD